MNKEITSKVQREMDIFFQANRHTTVKTLLWETCKVYIRGVLISQKAYVRRKKEVLVRKGQEEIMSLEERYKRTPTQKMKWRLDAETSKLKLIEVTQAARELMFSKQRTFEYRDTPNMFLAKILSDKHSRTLMPTYLMSRGGTMVDAVQDKLRIFADYYEKLHKSSQPEMKDIDRF